MNNNLFLIKRAVSSRADELVSQHQSRKSQFHKNPCKMHPVASWMVVSLFQDQETEIMQQQLSNQTATISHPNHTKFDIQLNDLNNGNMYKYRFDTLQLAQEWLEQFKLASTFHERQRPDNLIRFDWSSTLGFYSKLWVLVYRPFSSIQFLFNSYSIVWHNHLLCCCNLFFKSNEWVLSSSCLLLSLLLLFLLLSSSSYDYIQVLLFIFASSLFFFFFIFVSTYKDLKMRRFKSVEETKKEKKQKQYLR